MNNFTKEQAIQLGYDFEREYEETQASKFQVLKRLPESAHLDYCCISSSGDVKFVELKARTWKFGEKQNEGISILKFQTAMELFKLGFETILLIKWIDNVTMYVNMTKCSFDYINTDQHGRVHVKYNLYKFRVYDF
jgi:hypothetical protein